VTELLKVTILCKDTLFVADLLHPPAGLAFSPCLNTQLIPQAWMSCCLAGTGLYIRSFCEFLGDHGKQFLINEKSISRSEKLSSCS